MNTTTTTTTMVFQFGYCSLGFGSDLHEAVEDAQQFLSSTIAYDEIELFDNVQSPVDGGIYWTATESVINEYK